MFLNVKDDCDITTEVNCSIIWTKSICHAFAVRMVVFPEHWSASCINVSHTKWCKYKRLE